MSIENKKLVRYSVLIFHTPKENHNFKQNPYELEHKNKSSATLQCLSHASEEAESRNSPWALRETKWFCVNKINIPSRSQDRWSQFLHKCTKVSLQVFQNFTQPAIIPRYMSLVNKFKWLSNKTCKQSGIRFSKLDTLSQLISMKYIYNIWSDI